MKKLLLLLFCICCLHSVQAQNPAIYCWDTSFVKIFEAQGQSFSMLNSTKTRDGSIIMAGVTRTLNSGENIGLITKFDSTGVHLWTKKIDIRNEIHLIQELADGSIFISGGALVKLTPSGDIIWSKILTPSAGVNCPGQTTFIIKSAADGVNGELVLSGILKDCSRPEFLMVLKIDRNGNPLWIKTYESIVDPFLSQKGVFGFGTIVDGQRITVINATSQNTNGYMNTHLDFAGIDYLSGDLISYKGWTLHSDAYISGFTELVKVEKLEAGQYMVYGQTWGDAYPTATGHFAVAIFDKEYSYLSGYEINAKIGSYPDASRIKADKNGQLVYSFVTVDHLNRSTQHMGSVRSGTIVKQRKLPSDNILTFGIPLMEPLFDGSWLFARTTSTTDLKKYFLELYRLRDSDTSLGCLGTDEDYAYTTPLYYFPYNALRFDKIGSDLGFSIVDNQKIADQQNWSKVSSCVQQSFCNSLKISQKATTCNTDADMHFSVKKNRDCGARVNWYFNSQSNVQIFTLSDTTIELYSSQKFSGWLYAVAITSCGRLTDSVFVSNESSIPGFTLGPDLTICGPKLPVLHAGSDYKSYLWQNGSTDSVFHVTGPGRFFVTVTNSCGAQSSDTIIVRTDAAPFLDAGPGREKCSTDTSQLQATSGFMNYTWTPNYAINTNAGRAVIVSPGITTTYIVLAEKTPGCFASDSVTIVVNTAPPINLGDDRSICDGKTVTLNAGNDFTKYTWSTGAISNSIDVNTPGTYGVIAHTIQGCSSADTVMILDIAANPTVKLGEDFELCARTERVLDAGDFAKYLWSDGSTARSLAAKSVGQYAVTVTDQNGCEASDSIRVTRLLDSPFGFLVSDTTVCQFGKIELGSRTDYDSYLWSNNAQTKSIEISSGGEYWLQVTNGNGCSTREFVKVKAINCGPGNGLYVPNAFTPNDDGKNDVFKPILSGNIIEYRFTVYNRWGELIYSSSEPGKGWNGMVKGKKESTGTYAWYLNYQLEGGAKKLAKGTVVLIR